jgi:hypothetical protein
MPLVTALNKKRGGSIVGGYTRLISENSIYAFVSSLSDEVASVNMKNGFHHLVCRWYIAVR